MTRLLSFVIELLPIGDCLVFFLFLFCLLILSSSYTYISFTLLQLFLFSLSVIHRLPKLTLLKLSAAARQKPPHFHTTPQPHTTKFRFDPITMSFRMPLARLAGRVAQRPAAVRPTAVSPFSLPRAFRQRRPYSSQPPPPNSNKIKFWPFFLIIGLGSAAYVGLVNRRKGMSCFCASAPWHFGCNKHAKKLIQVQP